MRGLGKGPVQMFQAPLAMSTRQSVRKNTYDLGALPIELDELVEPQQARKAAVMATSPNFHKVSR
jgi:hypothetical protein